MEQYIKNVVSQELGGVNETLIYIQNCINYMTLRIGNLEAEVSKLWDATEEMVANISNISNMENEGELSELKMLDNPLSLEEVLAELEHQVPKAYEVWWQLFKNGEKTYLEDPSNNLIVEESRWADTFEAFGRLNWKKKGWLLDIGCGIQELPSYLKNYPTECIVGMDPLMPAKEHPFRFVQGIAEFIPFEDRSFDYVLSVTSLDHVLLLDRALQEMHRVLKDDGKLLLWIGEVDGAEEYNPYAEDVKAIDQCHMFHIQPKWFEPMMKKFSFIKESHYRDRWGNHFYAYTKKL